MSRETRRSRRNQLPPASDPPETPKKWGGARPNSGRPKATVVPAEPKSAGSKPSIDMARMAAMMPELLELSERYSKQQKRTAENNPYRLPWFPAKAKPPADHQMAMDRDPGFAEASNAWLGGGVYNALAAEGMLFPGYTYLSELAQRPEYRIISETIADDATRKWIKPTVVGEKEREEREASKKPPVPDDEDQREDKIKKSGKADKIKDLVDFMTQLQVRDCFYARCRDDGFYGRTHLYLDIKGRGIEDDPQQLRVSIGNGRSEASKALVNKTSPLRDLRVIEPVWTYPMAYNASNPLIADWYNPQFWYVMGQELHVSRILPLVSRPVPDILKPAYAFGGISLSQIAQPYVDIWLQTRASVAALIHSFSVMVLETDLQTLMQPSNAGGLIMRAMLFNALRDNQGLMVINQESEDFKNVSASLAGLSDLQAQAQEHVASIARIPLVKYTGLQPKGLNASSEGEIRVYYDTITAYQHRSIRPDLTIVFNFAQLSLYGEIDPDISFDFEPLWEMSQKEKSEKEKDDAERDMKYVDGGVLAPEEVRRRLANDPTLPYTDIDPDDVPDLAQEEEEGLVPGAASGGKKGGSEGGSEEGGGTANDNDPFGASDEFNEADHPRGQPGNAGQFGPGGGGSTGGKSKAGKKGAAAAGGSSSSAAAKKPLSPKNLEKTGPKMGTNDGGTFKDKASGKEFYIKKPQSPAHVTNELLGAKLYQMAGGNTLNYQPVEGGGHVATELVKLDKKNIKDFTPAEKKAAQKDFAVQAWIGNWDAAGTGGDNKGILNGKPTALDFGGALEYRAQGEPKGDAFGPEVPELETMLDPSKSPDNAKLYGDMSLADARKSAISVTSLTNDQIITAVKEAGGTATLAEKLIARKNFIAEQYNLSTDTSEWDDVKHPRNPDGTFAKGAGGENQEGKAMLSAGNEFTAATGLKPTDFNGFEQYMDAVEKFKKGQQQKAEAVAKEMEDPAAAAAGEGGEALKPGAYGGLWKAGGDGTPEGDFAHNAGFYSKAKTQIGIHYRRMLAKLIKDAPAHDLANAVPELKNKLIESLGLSYQKLIEKGDTAGAQKLAQTLSKLVGSAPPPAVQPAPAPEPKAPNTASVMKFSPKFAAYAEEIDDEGLPPPSGALKKAAAAVVAGDATAEALSAMLSPNEEKWLSSVYGSVQAALDAAHNQQGAIAKAVEQFHNQKSNSEFAKGLIKKAEKKPEPMPKVSQATPDELKKASKVTNVPVPADIKPEAKKLIEKFNMEYGVGTPAITDPAKLNKKVADYKAMQTEVSAINLKHMDEIKAAAAEKQKAEALKATKKLEDEAKALAQQFKDHPEMKTHYEAIQSLTGGGKAAQNYMANARAKVKDAGLEGVIRGEEAASIIAYSGSHYAPLNAALREGVTTVGQYKFMKSLNHALDKLPPYTKTTTRKASLTPQQFALYKPGMVVEERGFTSSSKKASVWSGTYHYTIHGKSGRDISMLSSSPGEAEVLFKSGTRFAVKKVSGNEIELEEID